MRVLPHPHTVVALVMTLALAAPPAVRAQAASTDPAEAAQRLATALAPGSVVHVRLTNGQRFEARLVSAGDRDVLLQPRTRLPVPAQAVPYEQIARLEPKAQGGITTAQAVLAGIGVGAGATLLVLGLVIASIAD